MRVRDKEIEFLFKNYTKPLKQIVESFSPQRLTPTLIEYFEKEKEAHVVLLFIDITSFSEKASVLTNSELSQYLDKYYEKTIPIIYEHGGEVEKIIGDGIICVFGEPFLNLKMENLIDKADKCSKQIILENKNSDYEVKVALHDGLIQYYKNKLVLYEYTLIGQPLTDLFRLESVSANNRLNYFCGSKYDFHKNGEIEYTYISGKITKWYRSGTINVNLKGSYFKGMRNYLLLKNDAKIDLKYAYEEAYTRILLESNKPPAPPLMKGQNILNYAIENNTPISGDFTVLIVRMIRLVNSDSEANMYRLITEVFNIVANSENVLIVSIEGENIVCVFETPLQKELQTIFSLAAQISTVIQNYLVKVLENSSGINFGLGVAYGKASIGPIPSLHSNHLHFSYSGVAYERAKENASKRLGAVVSGYDIFQNLTEHQKSLANRQPNGDYYFFIHRTKIHDYYEKRPHR